MALSLIAAPFPDDNEENNDNHVAVGMRMIIIIISVPKGRAHLGRLPHRRPLHIINIKHRKNCECCPGHYLSTSVY